MSLNAAYFLNAVYLDSANQFTRKKLNFIKYAQ